MGTEYHYENGQWWYTVHGRKYPAAPWKLQNGWPDIERGMISDLMSMSFNGTKHLWTARHCLYWVNRKRIARRRIN